MITHLPIPSLLRPRRQCQQTTQPETATPVPSAARRWVARHAGHAAERPGLGISFARNAAAVANYSCVRIGLPTPRRPLTKECPDGITGMLLGGNSATHSVAESERGVGASNNNGTAAASAAPLTKSEPFSSRNRMFLGALPTASHDTMRGNCGRHRRAWPSP